MFYKPMNGILISAKYKRSLQNTIECQNVKLHACHNHHPQTTIIFQVKYEPLYNGLMVGTLVLFVAMIM